MRPVDVRTSIAEGNPAKVLIERSKEADLLVVGARGREGFAGMLLGSVSQHIVAHAECRSWSCADRRGLIMTNGLAGIKGRRSF